jgi:hypothetical protein
VRARLEISPDAGELVHHSQENCKRPPHKAPDPDDGFQPSKDRPAMAGRERAGRYVRIAVCRRECGAAPGPPLKSGFDFFARETCG